MLCSSCMAFSSSKFFSAFFFSSKFGNTFFFLLILKTFFLSRKPRQKTDLFCEMFESINQLRYILFWILSAWNNCLCLRLHLRQSKNSFILPIYHIFIFNSHSRRSAITSVCNKSVWCERWLYWEKRCWCMQMLARILRRSVQWLSTTMCYKQRLPKSFGLFE